MTDVQKALSYFINWAVGVIVIVAVLAASWIAVGFVAHIVYIYFRLGWELVS